MILETGQDACLQDSEEVVRGCWRSRSGPSRRRYIRAYELPAEEAAAFTAMSLEQGWKPVLAASPENGAKLRDLFVK